MRAIWPRKTFRPSSSRRSQHEGINTDLVRRRDNARPLYCFIVIDQERQTRNIFFDDNTSVGPDPDWPPVDVIRSIGVLLVDFYAIPQMIRAATIARQAGVPVVADFEDDPGGRFGELLHLTDHLILSLDFCGELTGRSEPADVAQALWHGERQVVALTAGAAGCWYLAADAPGELKHQPAFRVEVADTTGCGDVFHGAYAFGLARGWKVAERMRFAAATAALKAEQTGGQAGIPNLDRVNAFLQECAEEHLHSSQAVAEHSRRRATPHGLFQSPR